MMSQALCTLWGGNSAQKKVTCPGHMTHRRPCHSEIQALRTDLCSVQVSGLHTAIPELSQAFDPPAYESTPNSAWETEPSHPRVLSSFA